MSILSENTRLELPAPSRALRIFSITVGLCIGIGLSMTGIHRIRPTTSVVSEKPLSENGQPSNVGPSHQVFHKSAGWHQLGLASWYGKEFQGKETANGEMFNMHDLTCAHRSLPLGTWLKVTNMHTRKWIVVRVNDRGPVPETRIADLSSEAARMLGMRSRGVTRVRLDVIDPQQAIEIARLERLRAIREAAEMQQSQVGN